MNKTLDFAFELKEIKSDGTFHGYGSVFGVKDYYDEIVAPGAFAETLAAHQSAGTLPAMLWQHRSAEPLGAYESMAEDQIGLKVSGRLALKTVRGAEAYELMTMKPRPAINGLSIGFQVREDTYDKVTGVTTLKKIDLWEVSLVTFPANDAARVQGVKTIEVIQSIRDAEKYLRDAGLSRKEAVAFIAKVKGFSQSESDEGAMQQLARAVNSRGAALAA
jgi:HK97 family phage prohead protease